MEKDQKVYIQQRCLKDFSEEKRMYSMKEGADCRSGFGMENNLQPMEK